MPGESKLTDKLIAPYVSVLLPLNVIRLKMVCTLQMTFCFQVLCYVLPDNQSIQTLTDIVHTNTPVLKSQHISAPTDRVLTFRNNSKGTKASEPLTNSAGKETKKGSNKSIKCMLLPQLHYVFIFTSWTAIFQLQCFMCKGKTVVTFKPCRHSVLCDVCVERVNK